ncbi:hypothetical protein BJX61DRAFT_241927 [Aspergillus egyptiacus]|nr:hypothetical protein BJX61DRAFT_241927 [Aspergillus egyptiacus]
MDAYAYLIRHGWSGPGNPLNPDRASTRGGLGLTKPLLISRRQGNAGVGNKTTKDPTNQWWLRGFEDALKSVGSEAAEGGNSGVGKGNALTSELYRHFVRGEVVPGTLGGSQDKGKDMDKEWDGKRTGETRKRKRDDKEDKEGERKEERKRRKEEKRMKKAEKAKRKEEKVRRREEKSKRKAEKREAKEKKREEKEKKRLGKKEKERNPEDDYPTPVSMDLDSTDSGPADGPSYDAKAKNDRNNRKDRKKDKESKKSKRDSSDDSSKGKSKKSKDKTT